MTLKLQLSPTLEERLTTEASRSGMAVEAYAVSVLEENLERPDRNRALSNLLETWLAAEGTEQEETGKYLVEALDEDRSSDRPFFPAKPKGVTW